MAKMSDIRELARGRWSEILTKLGIDAVSLDGKHRPCPACGGKDRFRFDDKDGRGTHICSQCDAGDGFELVRKTFSYSGFKEAATAVEEVLGIDGKPPSREQQQAYRRKLDAERKKREQQEAEAHRLAAIKAQQLKQKAEPASPDHPYLIAKGVKPCPGIYQYGGKLIVFVLKNSEVVSYQSIDANGNKLFLKDGQITGCGCVLAGEDPASKIIFIGEGAATCLTVRDATGQRIVIAFNAGNLLPVAQFIRGKYPDHEIIIAADNDHHTDGNPGLTKARAAAEAVGGKMVAPSFSDDDQSTDWNDYAAAHGLPGTHDAILNQMQGQYPTDSKRDNVTSEGAQGIQPISKRDEKINVTDKKALKPLQGNDCHGVTFQNPEPETASIEPDDTEPMDDAIDRLAQLSPLEYDKVRQAEAKVLKVRASTLDAAVSEVRKAEQEQRSMFAIVEPWPDEVNGCDLLDELSTTIRTYIVMPKHAPETVALWVLNTYVHDASYFSPILLISSPEKRSGKSTLLSLLAALCTRTLLAANISPAAVYRAIEQWQPTLLIDEADTFLKQNDDMAGVINSGHTKTTAFVIRCDGDANEPKRFSTWCAKVIAGIGSQRDTLEDRSIPVALRRKLPDEQVSRLRLDRNGFEDIQRKCMRWGDDNFQAVHESDPATPSGLHDRAADNWSPLLAIADLCGWREKAELSALALSGDEEGDSINTTLLADIRDIFKEQSTDRLSSQRLCDLLAGIDDRPWGEWSHGKPITTNRLAGRLKMFGIHSKTVRLPNGERLKGYALEEFKDAFTRYIPDSKRDNVTTQQYQQKTGISKRDTSENVTLQKSPEPLGNNECHGVTFQNEEPADGQDGILI